MHLNIIHGELGTLLLVHFQFFIYSFLTLFFVVPTHYKQNRKEHIANGCQTHILLFHGINNASKIPSKLKFALIVTRSFPINSTFEINHTAYGEIPACKFFHRKSTNWGTYLSERYRGKINISINHLFSHITEFSR